MGCSVPVTLYNDFSLCFEVLVCYVLSLSIHIHAIFQILWSQIKILFFLPKFVHFKVDRTFLKHVVLPPKWSTSYYIYLCTLSNAANPWCLTDGSLHNTGAPYLYSDSGWDQGDHWGLCEYSAEWNNELALNCPDYVLATLDKCIVFEMQLIFRMNNADEMSHVVFSQKRHKADNTVNKKKTTGWVLLSYLYNSVRN